jgi:CSLREA domain-containing protein
MYAKRFRTLSRLSIPACLLILLLVLPALTVRSAPAGAAAMAPAATIVVDTEADELDGSPGNGDCSLREAITNANNDNGDQADCPAGSGADIITLPADYYTLTGAAGEDDNVSGDLDIKSNLTINGAGSLTTIIQAGADENNGVDRVLHIAGLGITVEINDVTIRYGKTADGVDGASDNACKGSNGGGIYLQSSFLILNDCTVSYNRTGDGGDGCTVGYYLDGAGGYGGGIFSQGTLELNDTTVRENETGAGGDGAAGGDGYSGGRGGGIYIPSNKVVTLTNSIVSSNDTGAGGRGGDAVSGDAGHGKTGGDGGGIYNLYGTLTLIESTIAGNTTGAGGDGGDATSGDGGNGGSGGKGAGVHNYGVGGTMVAVDSVIDDNETGLGGNGGSGTGSNGADNLRGDGGGLYFVATHVTLSNSTISNNRGLSGGIRNTSGAVVTLANCTLSGNRAYENGGGIYNGSGATVALANSTVSGNRAYEDGGGIYNGNGGTATLTFVTVAYNTADLDSTTLPNGDGGGVVSFGTLTMTNTIVAKNSDKTGEKPDCYGTLTSGDYNLLGIGDSADCTFTPQANDQVGTTASPIDPLLGTLGDKGGPTWTHSLKLNSPAVAYIPAGVNGCVAGIRDQRGVLRFPPCNIGSFEQDQIEYVYLPLVLRNY